jgi:SAM-dependent methyltransferase
LGRRGRSLNPAENAGLVALLQGSVAPGDDCLDLGCGDGSACGPWLSEHAGTYLGVDISERALELARARGLKTRRIEDNGKLPFPDESFDVVVCSEVLEHLLEPQAAVSDAWRVLRPSGLIVVTVPNAAYIRRRYQLAVRGIFDHTETRSRSSSPGAIRTSASSRRRHSRTSWAPAASRGSSSVATVRRLGRCNGRSCAGGRLGSRFGSARSRAARVADASDRDVDGRVPKRSPCVAASGGCGCAPWGSGRSSGGGSRSYVARTSSAFL